MMPNLERIKLWTDELRSDTVGKQTTGRLRNEFGRCCLGVGADVAIKHQCHTIWNGDCIEDFYDRSNSDATFTPNVFEWYGLREYNPILKVPPHLEHKLDMNINSKHATTLNDVHKFTFAEIADCIDYTWPQA